jgi:hypothetical protein
MVPDHVPHDLLAHPGAPDSARTRYSSEKPPVDIPVEIRHLQLDRLMATQTTREEDGQER